MLSIKPRWASVNGSNSPCDCSTVARFGAGWRTAPSSPSSVPGPCGVGGPQCAHPTHDSPTTHARLGYIRLRRLLSRARCSFSQPHPSAADARPGHRAPANLVGIHRCCTLDKLPTSGHVSPHHHCPLKRDTTTFVTDRYMEEDKYIHRGYVAIVADRFVSYSLQSNAHYPVHLARLF